MSVKKYFAFILLSFFFVSCITTLSPGFFYNSTAEHVYLDRSTNQMGSGRIIFMEKSCTHNSFLLYPFYHGRLANVETVLNQSKIKRVGVVDYSSFSIFGGLYYSNCIQVWGDNE